MAKAQKEGAIAIIFGDSRPLNPNKDASVDTTLVQIKARMAEQFNIPVFTCQGVGHYAQNFPIARGLSTALTSSGDGTYALTTQIGQDVTLQRLATLSLAPSPTPSHTQTLGKERDSISEGRWYP